MECRIKSISVHITALWLRLAVRPESQVTPEIRNYQEKYELALKNHNACARNQGAMSNFRRPVGCRGELATDALIGKKGREGRMFKVDLQVPEKKRIFCGRLV